MTAKAIFECLYLVSCWSTIGKICNHALGAHASPLILTPILDFRAKIEGAPQFFLSARFARCFKLPFALLIIPKHSLKGYAYRLFPNIHGGLVGWVSAPEPSSLHKNTNKSIFTVLWYTISVDFHSKFIPLFLVSFVSLQISITFLVSFSFFPGQNKSCENKDCVRGNKERRRHCFI